MDVRTRLGHLKALGASAPKRTLFVKWVLLNAVTVVGIAAVGILFGGRVHGAGLVAIPVILAFGAYGSTQAGRLCWRAESAKRGTLAAEDILHELSWIDHWAWVCPMIGILSSIAGMSILISNNDTATLSQRVSSGGGGIFYGTFVGVLAMLLLRHECRMIEHDLR